MNEKLKSTVHHLGGFRKRARFRESLQSLMENEDFRVFWRQFLQDSGYLTPRFNSDPYITAFQEGRRHLAASYVEILTGADPEHIIRHLTDEKETIKREREEDYV